MGSLSPPVLARMRGPGVLGGQMRPDRMRQTSFLPIPPVVRARKIEDAEMAMQTDAAIGCLVRVAQHRLTFG
jgi:hypothetical protein